MIYNIFKQTKDKMDYLDCGNMFVGEADIDKLIDEIHDTYDDIDWVDYDGGGGSYAEIGGEMYHFKRVE